MRKSVKPPDQMRKVKLLQHIYIYICRKKSNSKLQSVRTRKARVLQIWQEEEREEQETKSSNRINGLMLQ
jgi:hypothetical protein